MSHVPVLLEEVVEGLNLHHGDRVVDATYGDGGHARAILEKIGPRGQLLGIDLDPDNIARAQKNAPSNLLLVNDNFVNLKKIVESRQFGPVKAVFLDLGWSRTQLEQSGRGFSFAKDEPLDLRLGAAGQTGADILNNYSLEELGRILREYGEERHWRKIALAIFQYRKSKKIERTGELVKIIKQALGLKEGDLNKGRRYVWTGQKIHPATKTWQALRIAVNDELGNLHKVLPQAVEILSSGGRLAIIAFHSLEDRAVKQFFKSQISKTLQLINKKPIVASPQERKNNPASRGAKLRIAQKL